MFKILVVEDDRELNHAVCSYLGSLTLIIKADGELLTLVWNNLFSNAVKFTEPGGEISVESTLGKGSTFLVKLRRDADETS